MPFVSRTRATLRSAEFGFLGVVVYTRVQTPRRCGAAMRFLRPWPDLRPGVETFFLGLRRPLRTSWLMLGMRRVMVAAGPFAPSPNDAAGRTVSGQGMRRLAPLISFLLLLAFAAPE